MTLQQVAALPPAARESVMRQLRELSTPTSLDAIQASLGKRWQAGGVSALRAARPAPGVMTKTERLYEIRLQSLQQAGQIQGYDYEAVRLKLADPVEGEAKTRTMTFLVDFTVFHGNGVVSFDETKGSWMSQRGKERWRWLADRFPFMWLRLWQFDKGIWTLRLESGKAGE